MNKTLKGILVLVVLTALIGMVVAAAGGIPGPSDNANANSQSQTQTNNGNDNEKGGNNGNGKGTPIRTRTRTGPGYGHECEECPACPACDSCCPACNPEPYNFITLSEKELLDVWTIVSPGAKGTLIYNSEGYDFIGMGLDEGVEYKMIYYPDPWPGTGLVCLNSGTPNSDGEVILQGTTDLTSIHIPEDENEQSKIWLVLASDVDCTNKKMIAWNPSE